MAVWCWCHKLFWSTRHSKDITSQDDLAQSSFNNTSAVPDLLILKHSVLHTCCVHHFRSTIKSVKPSEMQRNAGADATCTSNFLHSVLVYSKTKEKKSLQRSHINDNISTLLSPEPRETDNDHCGPYKFACQKLVGLEVQRLSERYTPTGGGYITEHLSKQLIFNTPPGFSTPHRAHFLFKLPDDTCSFCLCHLIFKFLYSCILFHKFLYFTENLLCCCGCRRSGTETSCNGFRVLLDPSQIRGGQLFWRPVQRCETGVGQQAEVLFSQVAYEEQMLWTRAHGERSLVFFNCYKAANTQLENNWLLCESFVRFCVFL